MADSMSPFWLPGEAVTVHANAALTAARFATIVGAPVGGNPRVGHAADRAECVIAFDTPAGGKATAYFGGILEVEAAAAITAGQYVKPDASGRAIVAADRATSVGVAVADIAANQRGPVTFGR